MKETFTSGENNYLDLFHQAQAKLVAGDYQAGKEILKQAMAIIENDDDLQDFLLYMKGTEAYLDQNMDVLKEAITTIKEPHNKKILERFLAKLEAGQDVDYNKDYYGL